MMNTRHVQLVPDDIENEFVDHYTGFTDFKDAAPYRPYWDLCMQAALDADLLSHIIFCNDVLGIPPVKTFLTVFTDDLLKIMDGQAQKLPARLKQAIGAFWGSVFKFNLGYTQQKSISASTVADFGLRTATIFWKENESLGQGGVVADTVHDDSGCESES